MKAAGLWPSYLEGHLLCGYKAGPYLGCAFLCSMREAAIDYAKKVRDPEQGAMFMHLYPELAQEFGLGDAPSFGTPEHIRYTHSGLVRRAVALKKGDRVKGARWFSFFRSAGQLQTTWYLQLFLLLWIGVNSKWFRTVQESPLFERRLVTDDGEELPPEANGPSAVTEHADEQPRGVRNSDAPDLPAFRKACRNTMHVACTLLADSMVKAQIAVMKGVVEPIEEEFHRMIRMQKARKGCREWLCSMSRGGYDSVVHLVRQAPR